MKNQNELSLLERFTAPTPKLFAIIRNGGVILSAVALLLMKLPAQGVAVPDSLLFLASKAYALAGAAAALVAQLTVDFGAYKAAHQLSKITPK